ncbi:putative Transcription factor Iwr1-containing protein, partial [Homarus americanus]
MATLIRIKRLFNEDPTDSIVVKSKRRRIEDEAAETSGDIFTPTILKRVATVSSKEEHLEPEVLKELQKEFKKGWQLREQYKRLDKVGAHRDAARRETKQRIKNKREEAHASHRPTLSLNIITRIIPEDKGKDQQQKRGREGEKDEGANCAMKVKPEDKGKDQQQKRGREEEKDEGANCAPPPLSTVEDIKYYDTELSSKKGWLDHIRGVIQKFPDWFHKIFISQDITVKLFVTLKIFFRGLNAALNPLLPLLEVFVDEVEEHLLILISTHELSDDDDKYEDDDDENDENNWRNDYPEEDDSSDECGYVRLGSAVLKPRRNGSLKLHCSFVENDPEVPLMLYDLYCCCIPMC